MFWQRAKKGKIMKAIKRKVFALTLCIMMMFALSPATALAANQPHPVCHHGDIGTSSSTMHRMGRTYYDLYDSGRKQYYDELWYKCSICGFETSVRVYY